LCISAFEVDLLGRWSVPNSRRASIHRPATSQAVLITA
jgi:hypothetical protein